MSQKPRAKTGEGATLSTEMKLLRNMWNKGGRPCLGKSWIPLQGESQASKWTPCISQLTSSALKEVQGTSGELRVCVCVCVCERERERERERRYKCIPFKNPYTKANMIADKGKQSPDPI
jgi:hypothetical protein